jgi:alcohol dehydrogenase class IV
MTITGSWNYPTPIRFGPGRIAELADACRELGMSRPLLVTDRGLLPLPITAKAMDVLTGSGLVATLFGDVDGNPGGADVDRGLAALRSGDCDGVVAFGGGSALDVGKAVALMAGQTRPLWDFEDVGDNYLRVNTAGMLPVVAVPTTSGTGSEVGRCSVIVNPDDPDAPGGRKVIVFHAKMLPERVIADPELTVGLPAKITAAVGMDALAHNLEAYCAPGFHPMADGIALEGMRLVATSLQRAVADGTDIEARANMLIASTMGATAFQKGLGAIHSLSHPVGVALHSHHGLTNAVFMPYVLVHNREAIEDRVGRLAAYLGLTNTTFTGFLDWVLALRESVGIPHTSAALGFEEHHAALLAPAAAADPTAPTNPIPVTAQDLESIYRKARVGQL